MGIDRTGLAEFLRLRREALQPEDAGLPRGPRRRASGLRREEAAELCHMSTDYYTRLEQERGPRPSEQMVAAIAQGLRLEPGQRDHLFRLAGHAPPAPRESAEQVGAGLQRIADRLHDTPAEIVTELGETLRQTPLGTALTGDLTAYRGPDRSIGYRWFTDPSSRLLYAPEDHPFLSRLWASGLREVLALRGPDSRAARLADLLLDRSEEFRRVWSAHEVGLRPREVKHFVHPALGPLTLSCQTLLDPARSHSLLVYTATDTDSRHKLDELAALARKPAS